MIKRLLFCFTLACAGSWAAAQDFAHDYTPIRSSGTLPEVFVKSTQVQTQEDIKKLKEKNYNLRKNKEEFLLKSNYVIDQLILSGSVLVNDPVSNYVNKVADEVLKDDPKLRGELQIYVTKSPVVNAYSFDKGIIFINMGLIAQLENEAQLAYVLGHEITHYVKKHSINAYVENIRIDKASYSTTSLDERELLKSNYSKENELEADMEGLNYLRNSNYSLKAVMKTFDVFQYSYLPFEEVEFDKKFFEDKDLVLPDEYFLKETQEIKGDDNYDDSKSTHPNVRKRRQAISEKINYDSESSRKKFIISEDDFKKCREICRFELCRLYLLEQEYMDAIYASYILLKKYPDNNYLHKIISKSLYAMAEYKSVNYAVFYSDGRYSGDEYDSGRKRKNIIPGYEGVEGSSQQVYHLFNKIKGSELTVLALSYSWKAHKLHPEDKVTSDICDSLFSLLVNRHNLTASEFSRKSKEELKMDIKKEEPADSSNTEEQSKYDKIRKKQAKTEAESEEYHFEKYAFIDYLNNDKEFSERFSHVKDTKRPVDTDTRKKKEKKKALALGVDKIVIVDPFYVKVDERKKDSYEYIGTEQSQDNYSRILTDNANKVGLQYDLIDPKKFSGSDIDKFNDFSVINDWVNERLDGGTNTNTMVLNTEEAKKLGEKYNTRYFLWSGVITVHGKKPGVGLAILSCVLIYTIPVAVYYLAKPEYETMYYSILFDVETGEVKMFQTTLLKNKDSDDMLNTYVYDTFSQIKRSKAK